MKNDNKIRCTCHLKPNILQMIDQLQAINPTITSRNEGIERAVEFYCNSINIFDIASTSSKKQKPFLDYINKEEKEWIKYLNP